MKSIKLESKKREVFGRKVKNLRSDGKIPANIFGKKIKSEAIIVDGKEFSEVYKLAGETQIIDLSGKPVLISNIQYDPVNESYLHVDFRQVDLSEKITASVPLVFEGESPAEKQSLGTVVEQIDEIEVEALPTDLPEKIIVDVSVLTEVDQAIYVKDLKIPAKVEVKDDSESIVVKVEPPQKEEEMAPPAPAEGEAPAEGTEAPTEGAETAEQPAETKTTEETKS